MTTKELQKMEELKAILKRISDVIAIKKAERISWVKEKQEFGFYSAQYRKLWNKKYDEFNKDICVLTR